MRRIERLSERESECTVCRGPRTITGWIRHAEYRSGECGDMAVDVDARYLRDALDAMSYGGEVEVSIVDRRSAIVMCEEGNMRNLFAVMPYRTH